MGINSVRWVLLLPYSLIYLSIVGFATLSFSKWPEMYGGPIVAFGFVTTIAMLAPSRKRLVSVCSFSIGSVLAWIDPHMWFYPEWHEQAYAPTVLPYVATLVGGLIGVAVVVLVQRKNHNKSVNSQH